MKVAEKGCAICQATWGDYWEEIEGQRMFFCCDICAIEFKNMVDEVKKRTGWKTLDEIKMTGTIEDENVRRCMGERGTVSISGLTRRVE